jgi:hypothetical protein
MPDLLFLCHGRLEFTQATLPTLIKNTDWGLVDEFVVYNDAAPDGGDTTEYLREMVEDTNLGTVRLTNLASPVGVMNHFIYRSAADRFAKIDNDIVVPLGWLGDLVDVMDAHPELELLGMQPGMGGVRTDEPSYSYTPAEHIGGVGLMQKTAFTNRELKPVANGRFGFTEWQHAHEQMVKGWISPDLDQFELDRIPVEPWKTQTKLYIAEGLNRAWPRYPKRDSRCWEWWTGASEAPEDPVEPGHPDPVDAPVELS